VEEATIGTAAAGAPAVEVSVRLDDVSEINVVAAAVVLSIIPVYFAQRLTSGSGSAASGSRAY
jgi:hypothetical protein